MAIPSFDSEGNLIGVMDTQPTITGKYIEENIDVGVVYKDFFSGFIAKPFSKEELKRFAHSALEKHFSIT